MNIGNKKIIYTGSYFSNVLRSSEDFRKEVVKRSGYDDNSNINVYENTTHYLNKKWSNTEYLSQYLNHIVGSNDFAAGLSYGHLEKVLIGSEDTVHINPMVPGVFTFPEIWKTVLYDLSFPIFVKFNYDEYILWCEEFKNNLVNEEEYYKDQETCEVQLTDTTLLKYNGILN